MSHPGHQAPDAGGRVVLITGCGSRSGIGFASARELAAQGYGLSITSTSDRIHERAAELRALGANVTAHPADLTEPAAAAGLVRHALAAFGRLDALVNNAGLTAVGDPQAPAGAVDETDAGWRAGLARNLDTVFHAVRAALPVMRAAGYGRIVTVASVSGPVAAYPGDVAYHAAKAATVGLTRAVAVEQAGHGITVNAVAPGWIDTGSATVHEQAMGRATPAGRPGRPDEVAGLVAWLAGTAASYVTGQVFVVDGGNSIAEERGRRDPG